MTGVFVYGPMVRYFAWRPVETADAGWVWLRRVHRRRQATAAHIPGPGWTGWQYWRYLANLPNPTTPDQANAAVTGEGQ